MARKPQTKKAEETAEAKAATPSLAEQIRAFKSARSRMSAYDVVSLAERLGVEGARTLPYDKLRLAMRKVIRSARHDS